MRLTRRLYKLSGLEYGTCSNVYALDYGEGIALIDAGTDLHQYGVIRNNLLTWGLADKPLTHVFLTHAHFDHAGNARRFQDTGAKLAIGREDGLAMEQGGEACLERLFGMPFPKAVPELRLEGGESFRLGDATVEAIAAPGHSVGSMVYRILAPGDPGALATGDLFSVAQTTPQGERMLELGWTGGPGFSWDSTLQTTERLALVEAELILTGHWAALYGESRATLSALRRLARDKAEA